MSSSNRFPEYLLEKNKNSQTAQYNLSDFNIKNQNPNRGINYGKMKPTALCKNYIDIENFLLGINSVNLEKTSQPFSASLNITSNVNFFDRQKIFLPQPFILEKTNRPDIFRR
jgi:hypothetical protein